MFIFNVVSMVSARSIHPHHPLQSTAIPKRPFRPLSSAPPGRHADGNGLYLFVQPSGTRSWIQRLVIGGRRRELGLGSHALVLLAEAGFSCSDWTIVSMTTSRLAWRSTVSCCTLNPRALPGRLDFLTPRHSRAPRYASWTDFPLRDRRSRRLWGNRNDRIALRFCGRNSVGPTVPIRPRRTREICFFSGA